MTTLNSAKRNTSGHFDAGYKADVRVLDFTLDLSTDATMGTATDDIQLATLPGGSIVVAMTVQQVSVGTGSGTLVGRVGSTTVTGTLASTAAAGTVATATAANLPAVVALAGAELNLLGATAVRTDGVVRVVVAYVEGDRSPRVPTIVPRDVI